MTEQPERLRVIYVTSDSSLWLAIDIPFGLISPPTISLHKPMVGGTEFYDAECYRLPIPVDALVVLGEPD